MMYKEIKAQKRDNRNLVHGLLMNLDMLPLLHMHTTVVCSSLESEFPAKTVAQISVDMHSESLTNLRLASHSNPGVCPHLLLVSGGEI